VFSVISADVCAAPFCDWIICTELVLPWLLTRKSFTGHHVFGHKHPDPCGWPRIGRRTLAIDKELEANILRYHHVEKWKVGTIARQLGIHHGVVDRVLSQAGMPKVERSCRPSIIDTYLPFIHETLKQYPSLTASRLYAMVRERGYGGGPDHFRHQVAHYRPRPQPEAFHRLKTLPGEQGQVDWGHFGEITIGKAKHKLMAFVLVLSYSRRIFLRFYLNAQMANFLRGHEAAFVAWKGLPRVLLYDNLKSAVLERQGQAIRFNPTLLDFASHYCFEPRPVAVARGNEKGRVERAIRYVRDNFWPARKWKDLDDLNTQALVWCDGWTMDRPCPEDRSISVRQAFAQEQPLLLSLSDNPYSTDERVEVSIGKTPYARFDRNDYSLPHTHVQRTLTLSATPTEVRILDGAEVIATHARSYDKGQQIEDPRHIEVLTARKRQARHHRGQDRLIQAAPNSRELLTRAAERGDNLGSITAALLRLLNDYAESLEQGVPHPNSVRQALQRHREERDQPPPIGVPINDERAKKLVVRPHDLNSYDQLKPKQEDGDDDTEK